MSQPRQRRNGAHPTRLGHDLARPNASGPVTKRAIHEPERGVIALCQLDAPALRHARRFEIRRANERVDVWFRRLEWTAQQRRREEMQKSLSLPARLLNSRNAMERFAAHGLPPSGDAYDGRSASLFPRPCGPPGTIATVEPVMNKSSK